MTDPVVRSQCDRSRRPDLPNDQPARAGSVKQGRRPPRQRLVLDRTEHAGNIRLSGKHNLTNFVTPAACPIYWWQNRRCFTLLTPGLRQCCDFGIKPLPRLTKGKGEMAIRLLRKRSTAARLLQPMQAPAHEQEWHTTWADPQVESGKCVSEAPHQRLSPQWPGIRHRCVKGR